MVHARVSALCTTACIPKHEIHEFIFLLMIGDSSIFHFRPSVEEEIFLTDFGHVLFRSYFVNCRC